MELCLDTASGIRFHPTNPANLGTFYGTVSQAHFIIFSQYFSKEGKCYGPCCAEMCKRCVAEQGNKLRPLLSRSGHCNLLGKQEVETGQHPESGAPLSFTCH